MVRPARDTLAARLCMLLPLIHELPRQIGPQHLRLPVPFRWTRDDVEIEYNEVGEFPRRQRADLVLLEQEPRVAGRVQTDRLLAGQRLLGVQWTVGPSCGAGDGSGDAEQRVVRIDRPAGAELLHVVRSSA